MAAQIQPEPAPLRTLAHMQEQRIRTFLVILLALNVPFLLLGLFDLPNSPWSLIRAIVSYIYYVVYYLLLRRGYGVAATYGCFVVVAILVASGVHDTGGFMIAVTGMFFLVLVAAGSVLSEPSALDFALALCLVSLGVLVAYELLVTPPPIFASIYQSGKPFQIGSVLVTVVVALVGIWLVLRNSLVGLRRATAALEQARAEAEARAEENERLAAQVQAGNTSLLTAQDELRQTVDALALPLIPLDDDVALLPLIGYLDDTRAKRMIDGLLQAVGRSRVRAVVLDITGLREVDVGVAATLAHVAQAVRLLGAEVVLSGLSAEAARALVELDADLHGIRTTGRLSDALQLVGGNHAPNSANTL